MESAVVHYNAMGVEGDGEERVVSWGVSASTLHRERERERARAGQRNAYRGVRFGGGKGHVGPAQVDTGRRVVKEGVAEPLGGGLDGLVVVGEDKPGLVAERHVVNFIERARARREVVLGRAVGKRGRGGRVGISKLSTLIVKTKKMRFVRCIIDERA